MLHPNAYGDALHPPAHEPSIPRAAIAGLSLAGFATAGRGFDPGAVWGGAPGGTAGLPPSGSGSVGPGGVAGTVVRALPNITSREN